MCALTLASLSLLRYSSPKPGLGISQKYSRHHMIFLHFEVLRYLQRRQQQQTCTTSLSSVL